MNIGFYPPRINFSIPMLPSGKGNFRNITLLQMKIEIGTFGTMKKMIRYAGVVILSLWMTLIIPVTACHHAHPAGSGTIPQESQTTKPGTTSLNEEPVPNVTLNTMPCVLCGRVLQPLPIYYSVCEGLIPLRSRITPPGPPEPHDKPDLHHLGDRSPPGSPTPC